MKNTIVVTHGGLRDNNTELPTPTHEVVVCMNRVISKQWPQCVLKQGVSNR